MTAGPIRGVRARSGPARASSARIPPFSRPPFLGPPPPSFGAPRRRARPGAGRGLLAVCVAVMIGLVGSGALVWRGTAAVFTATTSNGPNSWTLGQVSLSDDDAGSALLSATHLVPGSTGSNCLTVSYSGTVPTSVRLYSSSSSDPSAVGSYLNLTIEQGSGGGFGSCGSFVPSATIYSGTLADFVATKVDYGSGVGSWSPSAAATQIYRISYALASGTPGSKQSAVTTATFQWEAQA